MKKHNAYLSEVDPLVIKLYDEAETLELFGEDLLEDFGVSLPPELIERYKACMKEFKALQEILRETKNKK